MGRVCHSYSQGGNGLMGRIEWEDGWAILRDNGEWLASDKQLTDGLNLMFRSEGSPTEGDWRKVNMDLVAKIKNGKIVKDNFSSPNGVY
jgi:hypothetical protein